MNKTGLIYLMIFLLVSTAVAATVLRSNLDGREVFSAVGLINVTAERFNGLLSRSNIDNHYVNCPVNTYQIGENTTHRFCAGVNTSALSMVSSLNSLTGGLNIVAGSNIVVSTSGSNIMINSTATASGSAVDYVPSEGGGGTYRLDENFTEDNGSWTGFSSYDVTNYKLRINDYLGTTTSPNYGMSTFTENFNISLTLELINITASDVKVRFNTTGEHWLFVNQNDTHMRIQYSPTFSQEIGGIPKASGPYILHFSANPSTNESRARACWSNGASCSSWTSAVVMTKFANNIIIGAGGTPDGYMNLTRVQLTGAGFEAGIGSSDCVANSGGFNINNQYIMPTWVDNTTRPSTALYAGLYGFNCAENKMDIYNGTGWI